MSQNFASQSYALPSANDESEAQRLHDQHILIANCFEGRIVISPITLNVHSEVLDIGTGSGVWALDLATNYPNAQQAKIRGIDIECHLFPKEPPANVKFSTASVLALPTEWDNKFHFVHQRLLQLDLKHPEWSVAIKEIFRVIAHGGWVQLCEPHLTMISHSPCSTAWGAIIRNFADIHDLDLQNAIKIPKYLSEAGFVDIRVERRMFKLGHLGGDMGRRLGDLTIGAWKAMKTPVLSAGGFGMVRNEGEFESLIRGVEAEWKFELGAELSWYIIVGKKP